MKRPPTKGEFPLTDWKKMLIRRLTTVGLVLICGALTGFASGQAVGSSALPAMLQNVDIDQKLGERIALGLEFSDEQGNRVRLQKFFGEKPVLLTLVYYECPMLCGQVLDGLVRSLRPLSFTIGEEFEIVTVSIDPLENPSLAAKSKETYTQRYGRSAAAKGWHFLVGKEEAIRILADSVGFRFTYDPGRDEYAHASAIMILTPTGRIARYFYGIEYSPRDIRLGLVEASADRIGSPLDQVLLFCYHYDPATGRYGLVIMNVLRIAGALTILSLSFLIFILVRRDRSVLRTG